MLLIGGAVAAAEPLRVAHFHYPPLLFHPQETNHARVGYAPELAVLAFARAGRGVELVPRPLRRAMVELERGSIDAIAALNLRSLPGVRFGRVPVAALRIGCFTRRDTDWVYAGPASLEGKHLGSIAGYYYADADAAFQRHLDTGDGVRQVAGPGAQRALIGMLLAGRIDVFCNDVAHVSYTLGEYFPGRRLRRAGELAGTIYAYFAVNAARADAAALLATYDRQLRTLFADGTVRRVLESYGFFRVAEGEALYREMASHVRD